MLGVMTSGKRQMAREALSPASSVARPANVPNSDHMAAVRRRTTICLPFTADTVGGSHISVLGLLNHLDRTPVVATRSGGNIEAIREDETGVLVAPEDASALAAGCARLVRDQTLRSAIAERAQADARSRFGEQRHCEEVSRVYDHLVPPTALSGEA